MGQYRMERLNVQLRDEISNLILRGEIRDPRVTGRKGGVAARTEVAPFLSINRVEVSQDLSYAKVFVSSFASDSMLDRGVDGLNNAAGFIQSTVAKKLSTFRFPKLTFVEDTSIKDGFDMVNKLNRLEESEKQAEEAKSE